MNRHVTNAHFKPVKPFVTAPETLQECPCVHRFRWRIFWTFFCVNFDLMHSKNWTPIKLETCNVNVLCRLGIKYCIIQGFIVECNLAIKLKDHSFPYCLCKTFALFCVKNSLLKFVQAFCIHPVYCYNYSSFFAWRKFVDVKLFLYLILSDFLVYFSKIRKCWASGRLGK